MSSDVKRLPLALYLPELQKLREAEADFILVAGQAVNFWAQFFDEFDISLQEFAPFVSKDVDLFGSIESLYKIPNVLQGNLKRFKDVRQPVVGVFTTDSKPVLTFELLRSIYGPVSAEKVFQRVQIDNPIRVIDPLSLLVCKCHNAAGIDQENRQDIRHVKMMVKVANAYFRQLSQSVGTNLSPRQFINECKYLLDFASDHAFQKGIRMADTTIEDCFPVDEIQSTAGKYDSIARFCENTLLPTIKKLSL